MGSSKANIIIIVMLIAFLVAGSYFIFKIRGKQSADLYSNTFSCGNQKAPFRVNISSCYAVPVSPDDGILTNTLTSPFMQSIGILVDPNETGGTGVSAFEIYKTYKALEPQTGVKVGIAYTRAWAKQPNIPIASIEQAKFETPIIWLRQNQSKTIITADGPRIYVDAASQQDLDAASCKISILVIKKVLSC